MDKIFDGAGDRLLSGTILIIMTVIDASDDIYVDVSKVVVNNEIGDNNVMKKDLILDSGYKLSRLGIILSRISRFGMSRVGTI